MNISRNRNMFRKTFFILTPLSWGFVFYRIIYFNWVLDEKTINSLGKDL